MPTPPAPSPTSTGKKLSATRIRAGRSGRLAAAGRTDRRDALLESSAAGRTEAAGRLRPLRRGLRRRLSRGPPRQRRNLAGQRRLGQPYLPRPGPSASTRSKAPSSFWDAAGRPPRRSCCSPSRPSPGPCCPWAKATTKTARTSTTRPAPVQQSEDEADLLPRQGAAAEARRIEIGRLSRGQLNSNRYRAPPPSSGTPKCHRATN